MGSACARGRRLQEEAAESEASVGSEVSVVGGGGDEVAGRRKQLIRHLLGVRFLQRVYAYSGHHLREVYPAGLRDRLVLIYPPGRIRGAGR